MKVAIMQPYIFPYLGYFQLLHAVDTFVVYDDVAFINRGWINRNRILIGSEPTYFTIPLSKASQNRLIKDTTIASEQYDRFHKKFLATLHASYHKAPFYRETLRLVEEILAQNVGSIADMACTSIKRVSTHLGIGTRIVGTSAVYANAQLKKADRLIDICRQEGADTYINAAGGQELYTKEEFAADGITLRFLCSQPVEYPQVGRGSFVPHLSILDVLMNNSPATVAEMLSRFDLV